MQENISNLHPVLYLVLNLESLARDNRFVWSHETAKQRACDGLSRMERVRGLHYADAALFF